MAKSTWWSVTAFGDEISLLESNEYPEFVAKVYGGREQCPTTGREHFQGAVQCRRQVRISQFKQWLAKAHLEPARDRDALRKYAMKADTAVGEKVERGNSVECISVKALMLKLASVWDEQEYIRVWDECESSKKAFEQVYWASVRLILREFPPFREVPHLFARSDVVSLWRNTRQVWLELEGGYSITPPTRDNASACEEKISNEVVYDSSEEA